MRLPPSVESPLITAYHHHHHHHHYLRQSSIAYSIAFVGAHAASPASFRSVVLSYLTMLTLRLIESLKTFITCDLSWVKGPDIYISPLTWKPEQQRFTMRSGMLASISSRQHRAMVHWLPPGRPRKTWIQQIGDGTTTSWDRCGRMQRNVDIVESRRNGPQPSTRHVDDWLQTRFSMSQFTAVRGSDRI